jgi:hypothetical protein
MSSQSTTVVYRARASQGTWSGTNQLVKNAAKHIDFFSKSGKKSLLTSLHIPAPHSRSHTTCNVVARVQKISYWTHAIATSQASLQQNRESQTQSFLDTTLGEDNRSVQNSHLKINSCTKQPEKTTIPPWNYCPKCHSLTPQYHERRPFHTKKTLTRNTIP